MFKKNRYHITIHFEQEGRTSVTLKGVAKQQSLLNVLLHNHIDIKHDCGGVCACSSCHIYVTKGWEHLEEVFVREKHFLSQVNRSNSFSRLACQCLLTDKAGSVELTIPFDEK